MFLIFGVYAKETESCTERSDIFHTKGRVTMSSIEGITGAICFGFTGLERRFVMLCLRVAGGLVGFCMRTALCCKVPLSGNVEEPEVPPKGNAYSSAVRK